jgi:hypothetical protein
MENSKNIIVAGIVGVVALGVAYFVGSPTVIVTPSGNKVVQNDAPSVGGASSDFSTRYLSFGGVREWASKIDLNGDAASTTICVIQAPQVASSSLKSFAYRANTGTGTAMELKVYKSASQWLTTTQLGGDSALAANQAVVVVATSSAFDSVNSLFSANDWLVVTATVAAGGAGTSSPTGVCQAKWEQI